MVSKAAVLILCFALVLASVTAADNVATRRLLQAPSWFNNPNTVTNTGTNAGGGTTSGGSGSSGAGAGSGVTTTGGSGTASSFASSAVIQAAASACASATASAFAAANVCRSNSWSYVEVEAASATCAKALVKVALSGYSSTSASGKTTACANTRSTVAANARAVASAAADAIAQASANCVAVVAYVRTEAFSAAFVDVCATALTGACSYSSGGGSTSAYAAVSAQIHAWAASIATSYGNAWARACAGGCSAYAACGSCPYSAYDTSAVAATLSQVTDGKYAVTAAMADAAARACGDHNYRAYAEAVGAACIDVCLSAYARLHTYAYARSGSISCASLYVEAELKAVASAAVKLVAGAYASNWGAPCAEAVSYVQGEINENAAYQITSLVIGYYASVCSTGGAVQVDALISYVLTNCDLVTVLTNAQADARAQCLCNNPGCCSTCDWSSTCTALVPIP